MDPKVFRCKVLNTLHVQEVFIWGYIDGPSGINVQSNEYFAHARRIFLKLDKWTPRYLDPKYWILCTCKNYFSYIGSMVPQVSRCKELNTLHMQELFFLILDRWSSRYLGAKNWILCTCKKYFSLKLYKWTRKYLGTKYWILCTCKKYFLKLDRLTPR